MLRLQPIVAGAHRRTVTYRGSDDQVHSARLLSVSPDGTAVLDCGYSGTQRARVEELYDQHFDARLVLTLDGPNGICVTCREQLYDHNRAALAVCAR